MASYYGIEKEDIAQGVDWNKIGKTYSDMLINERDRREKKKAEIDETIRQDLKTIENMPQGKHRGVTDGLASLAEKLREQTLMYQRELKGGDLKLKDWTLQRQNLMDDTERVQKIGEGLQSQYGEIIKGFEDGELSQITVDEWSKFGNLIDFNTHDFYIDPKNGKMFIAELNEDGSINTRNTQSIESIQNGMQHRYKRYDMNGFLEENIENIAEFSTYYKDGTLVSDPRIKKEFDDYKKAAIDGVFSNESNVASILIDDMPTKGYSTTNDREEFENDKTGKLIFAAPSDNNSGLLDFEFKPEQEEAVRNHMNNAIEVSVGFKKTPPKDSGRTKQLTERVDIEMVEDVNTFTTGDPDSVLLAEKRIIERFNAGKGDYEDKTIKTIDRTADGGINITFMQNGKTFVEPVPFEADATNEERQETFYSFVNPDRNKFNWSVALDNFGGARNLTNVPDALVPYESKYAARSIPNYGSLKKLPGMPEGNPEFKRGDVAGQGAQIESILDSALQGNVKVDATRSEDDTNAWTITLTDKEGRAVGKPYQLEWKRGTAVFKGKLNLNEIMPQLERIYQQAISDYNSAAARGGGAQSSETDPLGIN